MATSHVYRPAVWHGEVPCVYCKGTLHSQYESKASTYVCAGCYNELAVKKGWETPISYAAACMAGLEDSDFDPMK